MDPNSSAPPRPSSQLPPPRGHLGCPTALGSLSPLRLVGNLSCDSQHGPSQNVTFLTVLGSFVPLISPQTCRPEAQVTVSPMPTQAFTRLPPAGATRCLLVNNNSQNHCCPPQGLHITPLARVAYHHPPPPHHPHDPMIQVPPTTPRLLGSQGHRQPSGNLQFPAAAALQTGVLGQTANVSQQTGGKNIRLAVRACPPLPGHSLTGATVQGAGVEGGGKGQKGTALQHSECHEVGTQHPSTQPVHQSGLSLLVSPLSRRLFLTLPLTPGTLTGRRAASFPHREPASPARASLLASQSLADLDMGSPLGQDVSGAS